ncbi:MAG: Transcriptional regulator, AraC family [uncultured Thiotrichaceae bacterium]|uniref:Transcriptional regulator, AraC family n=1 Tax=uncultured Thiotrichaceae bacterium TaxID=298394 RepID=A0A6S6TGL8_9GAMM|nr:MAG: Transcriptional regulator, AraC family [uncultured Thiotrichaceae bacterium]
MKVIQHDKLKSLVENKLSYYSDNSELGIYNTYQKSSGILFKSNELIFGGALAGRKIMHTQGIQNEQVFLPHESYIVAPGETIEIDFPDASLSTPTTCITVEISNDKMDQVTDRLHSILPDIENTTQWELGSPILHTHHCTETQHLLNRLAKLFQENHPDRELMIDLNVSELIVRLLRHKTRDFLLARSNLDPEFDGLTNSLTYIQDNLSSHLDIEKMCKLARMSRSCFYIKFKKKLGCTPLEFQLQLRLSAAAQRIKQHELMTTISYDLGFSSPSHFSRLFKKHFGYTPSCFKKKHTQAKL